MRRTLLRPCRSATLRAAGVAAGHDLDLRRDSHACWRKPARISGDCAPETPNFRSATKNGTAEMPSDAAVRSSSRTASAKRSPASSSRTSSAGSPASTPSRSSAAWSLISSPSPW